MVLFSPFSLAEMFWEPCEVLQSVMKVNKKVVKFVKWSWIYFSVFNFHKGHSKSREHRKSNCLFLLAWKGVLSVKQGNYWVNHHQNYLKKESEGNSVQQIELRITQFCLYWHSCLKQKHLYYHSLLSCILCNRMFFRNSKRFIHN